MCDNNTLTWLINCIFDEYGERNHVLIEWFIRMEELLGTLPQMCSCNKVYIENECIRTLSCWKKNPFVGFFASAVQIGRTVWNCLQNFSSRQIKICFKFAPRSTYRQCCSYRLNFCLYWKLNAILCQNMLM